MRSESERGADRDHRGAAAVDGVDDLGVVDALEVDRGDVPSTSRPPTRNRARTHGEAAFGQGAIVKFVERG
jgi:hypothetical protein